MPPVSHPDFHRVYMAALQGLPMPDWDTPDVPHVSASDLVRQSLARAFRRARRRASSRGIPFDIDMDWLLAEAESQGFRCGLTGIPFYAKHKSKCAKNPFAPSMDQILPSGGYTKSNVRLVVFAINAMMMDWGQEVFEHVARSYRNAQKKNIYSRTLNADART